MRSAMALVLAVLGLAFGSVACADDAATGKSTPLLTRQDETSGKIAGWKFFCESAETKPKDVWQLGADGVLVCKGSPLGYIATEKDYKNFTLRLEWRWPKDKPGKGGVLVRQTGEDRIWPKSLEAQINAGDVGDLWGLAGFALTGPADRLRVLENKKFGKLTNVKKTADQERPAGEWNSYVLKIAGDTITLWVNGQEVNRATGCEVVAGKILLTAEGTEIHFRNIELTPED